MPRALLIAALAAVLPALADDDGLKRCRAIGDAAARLVCYDALPLATAPAGRGPVPAGRPVLPAAPVSPAAAAPAREPLVASFGMEGRAPAAELAAIESHIPGAFEGWSQNTLVRLANGQVWQVVDEGGRRMRLQDPKVRVRRGAMGAFYLEFEAHNYAPRVRRVQ